MDTTTTNIILTPCYLQPLTNSPPSLLHLAARYCIQNLASTLATPAQPYRLKSDLSLPSEVCEVLLEKCREFCGAGAGATGADGPDTNTELFNNLIRLFEDPTVIRLSSLNLSNTPILPNSLQALLLHNPIELNVCGCPNLDPTVVNILNCPTGARRLKTLILGSTANVIFPDISSNSSSNDNNNESLACASFSNTFSIVNLLSIVGSTGSIFPNLASLQTLVIHNYSPSDESNWFWANLLPRWDGILVLDLSNCEVIGEAGGSGASGFSGWLDRATNLRRLCLYNVNLKEKDFGILNTLHSLNTLDISTSTETNSTYSNPTSILRNLIISLPNLTSLDISGTNLASRGSETVEENCDIPGLESRVEKPLEFLGLYGSHHDASHRLKIPAKRVAGDKDEAQVLIACQAYLGRAELLEKIFNDLFHLHRHDKGTQTELSLRLILDGMKKHLSEKHICISGSASLFYIIKSLDKTNLNLGLKKELLKTLIDSMSLHRKDSTMLRNGCLTICLFTLPNDVIFYYRPLIRILLDLLSTSTSDPAVVVDYFVERMGIYLLNSLGCQVDKDEKELVGELGGVETLLKLINSRLISSTCDDVMEIAWSTLWNITDETPLNCSKFLEHNGMNLFLNCLRTFGGFKPELLRNMMGLLGNIAEVKFLRPQLMITDFVNVFYELLDSDQDNIEVSYNAAGILAHLLSDPPTSPWTITSLNRLDITSKLGSTINGWNIRSTRNINYRSFEPILRLIRCGESVCQQWGCWAVANLTMVYPDKYIPLLISENGIEVLSNVLKGPSVDEDVRRYAELAYKNLTGGHETFGQSNGVAAEVESTPMAHSSSDTSGGTSNSGDSSTHTNHT